MGLVMFCCELGSAIVIFINIVSIINLCYFIVIVYTVLMLNHNYLYDTINYKTVITVSVQLCWQWHYYK